MESLNDVNNENKNVGFFNYIFNFDDENKSLILNMFQFTFLSIPLIIIFLKLFNYFMPEENSDKGNLEILSEGLKFS